MCPDPHQYKKDFGLGARSEELFLMGLFSVLDVILEEPMVEALKKVTVSEGVRDALVGPPLSISSSFTADVPRSTPI